MADVSATDTAAATSLRLRASRVAEVTIGSRMVASGLERYVNLRDRERVHLKHHDRRSEAEPTHGQLHLARGEAAKLEESSRIGASLGTGGTQLEVGIGQSDGPVGANHMAANDAGLCGEGAPPPARRITRTVARRAGATGLRYSAAWPDATASPMRCSRRPNRGSDRTDAKPVVTARRFMNDPVLLVPNIEPAERLVGVTQAGVGHGEVKPEQVKA